MTAVSNCAFECIYELRAVSHVWCAHLPMHVAAMCQLGFHTMVMVVQNPNNQG